MSEEKPRTSLSIKLLGFTVLFGLLAQMLIFFPSLADFRTNWLEDKLASARTAALVFEAAPDNTVKAEVTQRLLRYVGALSIAIKKGDSRELLASWYDLRVIDVSYDLRNESAPRAMLAALQAWLPGEERILQVIGPAPLGAEFVELVVPEGELKTAIRTYSLRLFALSLFISVITAGLLYIVLNTFFVRPLKALSENMSRFRDHPENPSNIIAPTTRRDEIGQVQDTLKDMQNDIQNALRQKTHLAALGLAVAKINHDLRNILTPVQLFADRLATLPDPDVQRFMPKILNALDRAVSMCQNTLAYGRATEPAPRRQNFNLHKLVDDMAELLDVSDAVLQNAVPRDLVLKADPDQIYRVLLNLVRNGLQACGQKLKIPEAPQECVRICAKHEAGMTLIEVSDTGPGIPPTQRKKLFQPFAISSESGGSGLGLAIAAELIRGHGGTIELLESVEGAHFMIHLPDEANTALPA